MSTSRRRGNTSFSRPATMPIICSMEALAALDELRLSVLSRGRVVGLGDSLTDEVGA